MSVGISERPLRSAACLTVLVTLTALSAGCSDRPKLYPVKGKVLIDGKPLTYGTVQVQPENGRAAFGEIGFDGSFSLTTYDPNDGCLPGKHPVVVVAGESAGSNAIRWLAPKKYSDPGTSGLTIDVQQPTDNLVIELTWDGGKPFIERFAGE